MNQTPMRGKLLLICLGAAVLASASASDLQMQIEPAFVGFGKTQSGAPLIITLANKGGDARGTLHVSTESFQMDYPIELPHDSVKRLTVYPDFGYLGEANLELATNQGDLRRNYHHVVVSGETAQVILYVGDDQGSLGFLRPKPNESVALMTDAYVKPENAPDRASAYADIGAIVLGAGSERLPDGAIRAIHNYVASGGAVAFLGGASTPVLGDKRWADILPVVPGKPRNVHGSQLIDNLSDGRPLGAEFTILECEPTPEASVRREDGNVILARRDVGLGRTLFIAFNPLDQPFTRWPGRQSLFQKVLRPIDSARAERYLNQFSGLTAEDNSPGYPYYATSRPTYRSVSRYDAPPGADPFSTTLPPPGKVFWILASYFVVIIPINFLLLKKLKRGELAWFTAPLISVAFAGVFFAAASDLYSANLSTATQGLILATGDSADTLFFGKSQLFFPRGGEYDLKLDGLETIGSPSAQEYDYGYRADQAMDRVNPIDVGHILVSRMDVNNLAFRELAYRQVLPPRKWLSVSLKDRHLTVVNVGAHTLESVVAEVAGQTILLAPSLAPGETASIEIPKVVTPDETTNAPPDRFGYGNQPTPLVGLAELTASTKGIVIKAKVKDPPVGPGIGSAVDSRQDVTLAYFTGLHIGKVDL
ncbi:MAG TPA: hypothetical protein VHE55_17165 [Fimbriimonadaceae bacterium]|nr:hypothetical protein [Fimbriimonadaceae bacterium]